MVTSLLGRRTRGFRPPHIAHTPKSLAAEAPLAGPRPSGLPRPASLHGPLYCQSVPSCFLQPAFPVHARPNRRVGSVLPGRHGCRPLAAGTQLSRRLLGCTHTPHGSSTTSHSYTLRTPQQLPTLFSSCLPYSLTRSDSDSPNPRRSSVIRFFFCSGYVFMGKKKTT
jgi:hypothetical protein